MSSLVPKKLYRRASCLRCVRMKRRCTGDLNGCSRCLAAGEQCEYGKSRRKTYTRSDMFNGAASANQSDGGSSSKSLRPLSLSIGPPGDLAGFSSLGARASMTDEGRGAASADVGGVYYSSSGGSLSDSDESADGTMPAAAPAAAAAAVAAAAPTGRARSAYPAADSELELSAQESGYLETFLACFGGTAILGFASSTALPERFRIATRREAPIDPLATPVVLAEEGCALAAVAIGALLSSTDNVDPALPTRLILMTNLRLQRLLILGESAVRPRQLTEGVAAAAAAAAAAVGAGGGGGGLFASLDGYHLSISRINMVEAVYFRLRGEAALAEECFRFAAEAFEQLSTGESAAAAAAAAAAPNCSSDARALQGNTLAFLRFAHLAERRAGPALTPSADDVPPSLEHTDVKGVANGRTGLQEAAAAAGAAGTAADPGGDSFRGSVSPCVGREAGHALRLRALGYAQLAVVEIATQVSHTLTLCVVAAAMVAASAPGQCGLAALRLSAGDQFCEGSMYSELLPLAPPGLPLGLFLGQM